jgi:beta-lactamase regulating signal transducer with metallopeptidase domain
MFGDIMAAEVPAGAAPFFAACGLKSAAILAAALLACAAMRRTSAAARHVVVSVSLAGLLVLPLVSAFGPSLAVVALPGLGSPDAPREEEVPARGMASPTPLAVGPNQADTVTFDDSQVAGGSKALQQPGGLDLDGRPVNWAGLLMALWVVGAFAALLPVGLGLLSTMRKARNAETITAPAWIGLLDELRQRLGVRRPVRLLRCGEGEIPTTWGVFRSVIALPAEADAWPEDRKRVVLLHELAHVKRHDYAIQLMGYIARAQHWFNPLAWLAVQALRMESERACDDLLLGAGSRASDYARHLIDMVRTLRPASSAAFVAIAMARRTWLERRIRAILDGRIRRGAVSRRALGAALVVAVAACGVLAVLQPASRVLAGAEDGVVETTLACGAKVALISVRRHNADDKTFWRPDGTPMAEAPYDHYMSPMVDDGRDLYEVAWSYSDLPDGVILFGTWVPERRGGVSASTQFDDWNGSGRLNVETVSVPKGTQTITVGLRVPDGNWRQPFNGATFGGESGAIGSGEWSLAWGELYEKDGEARITVTDNGTATKGYSRLVATDASGAKHYSSHLTGAGGGNFRVNTFRFRDVSVDDIREFRFETCGYESAEFRNVSLAPGQHTEVKLSPRAIDPAGPASRNGARYQRLIGMAFKMYANEAKGERWPAKTSERGAFYPELSDTFLNFLGDGNSRDELVAYLKGETGVAVCYLGYGVNEDEKASEVLAHYRTGGAGQDDLELRHAQWPLAAVADGVYHIQRIRSGVERFFITDINDPTAGERTRSRLPVLWELPHARRDGAIGGHVLYMDGHTEWKPYPGEFPMTEQTVTAIREAMQAPVEKQSADAGTSERTGQGRERTRDTEPEAPLRLIRILPFEDDSYRAQIAVKSDVRARWYREGEAFDGYRIERIDPDEETVTVYSEGHKEIFVLRLEMIYDAGGTRAVLDADDGRVRIIDDQR